MENTNYLVQDVKSLFIPEIGTKFTLYNDWVFTLNAEDRNKTLASGFGLKVQYKSGVGNYLIDKEGNELTAYRCTLPEGTVLKVDRIYVRQGQSEFSSVTFRVDGGDYDKCRFWANLGDINKIVYTDVVKPVIITCSTPIRPYNDTFEDFYLINYENSFERLSDNCIKSLYDISVNGDNGSYYGSYEMTYELIGVNKRYRFGNDKMESVNEYKITNSLYSIHKKKDDSVLFSGKNYNTLNKKLEKLIIENK